MNVEKLSENAREQMISQGYSVLTAWHVYKNCFVHVIEFHRENGKVELDEALVDLYRKRARSEYDAGQISYNHYRFTSSNAERLVQYSKTGVWEVKQPVKKHTTSDYYEGLLLYISSQMAEEKNWKKSSQKSFERALRHHFLWLNANGFSDISLVTAEAIRLYFTDISDKFSGTVVLASRCYLRQVYEILYLNGYIETSYTKVFDFKVPVQKNILLPPSSVETYNVLSKVNRITDRGKRDYAIIILAVVTGLRAIDIANLKLSDINWAEGKIRIIQEKTGSAVHLPLTKDVGIALQDYILNGRRGAKGNIPENEEHIFIALRYPYTNISAHAIKSVYEKYRVKAGYFQNNGIHSLRRAVGTNMAISGVSVETIAQVLGHTDINSTNQYLSLDSKNLKQCGLSLSGIEYREVD